MIDINGWQEIKLGQMGKFSTSSVDKKSIEGQKQVSLVNYMDVYSGNTIDSNIKLMKVSASVVERARSQVFRGDILFTPSSETPEDIGYSAVVGEELTDTLHSYHTVMFRPNSNMLDIRFSAWFANAEGVRKQFSQKCAGSTRYILSIPSFQSVKCKIPISLTVQRKIANCLDTVQTTIEKTEALIHKYQQIKAGLMHDLFTRGVTADGKLRPPREQAPELYKETPIGWIPKEWGEKSFRDICVINQGLQIAIENRFKEDSINRYVYITIQYLNNIKDELNRFYIENPDESVICSEDDILMTRTGNTGMVVTDINGVFHNNFFKISYKKDNAKEFIVYYLRRPVIQNMIMNYAGTTTIPDLNHSDFYRLPFIRPNKEEQNKIVKSLKTLDAKIEIESKYYKKMRSIKQGLMYDLLTGKVPVKVDQEKTDHV